MPRFLSTLFAAVLLIPPAAWASRTPVTAGPLFGVDDWNTASIYPSPEKKVSSIPGAQCPWINTGLSNFESTHPGWSHAWASQAEMAKVEDGIEVLDYYAWVVSEPDKIKSANGVEWPVDAPLRNSNNNVNDVGGAVFNLKYTPVAGAHAFNDLHWVQGLYAHYDTYGNGPYQTRLDNPFANNTPFYDDGATAGKLADGGGWFLDTPWKIEAEALETNPVADVQFQVVLADYNSTTKLVTLYGGLWWGYTYEASDTAPVPEPTAILLLAILSLYFLQRPRLIRVGINS